MLFLCLRKLPASRPSLPPRRRLTRASRLLHSPSLRDIVRPSRGYLEGARGACGADGFAGAVTVQIGPVDASVRATSVGRPTKSVKPKTTICGGLIVPAPTRCWGYVPQHVDRLWTRCGRSVDRPGPLVGGSVLRQSNLTSAEGPDQSQSGPLAVNRLRLRSASSVESSSSEPGRTLRYVCVTAAPGWRSGCGAGGRSLARGSGRH